MRGVRVHNLRNIDLDLPRNQLIAICGVSGSGKTSLALDTLYAEGQRRYIESFSAYTRQFLQRLERPDCESIEGLPPAVAVTRSIGARTGRSTVATATELADYLRLLYAKVAELYCLECGTRLRVESPQAAAERLVDRTDPRRLLVTYRIPWSSPVEAAERLARLQQDGYLRVIVGDRSFHLAEDRAPLALAVAQSDGGWVIVDRLRTDLESVRLAEAIGNALREGLGQAQVWTEERTGRESVESAVGSPGTAPTDAPPASTVVVLDSVDWQVDRVSTRRQCVPCGRDYPEPEPRLFSFNSPLGACPQCEGFGDIVDFDWQLMVPDPRKSIRDGAIAPWSTPSYRHEWESLVQRAPQMGLDVDRPFSELAATDRARLLDGVPEADFGGLRDFFARLDRKKYKMHVRVFLARWRSYSRCPTCEGRRLRPEALAYRLGHLDLAQFCRLEVDQAIAFVEQLDLPPRETQIAAELLQQIRARLGYLRTVGLGYLQLDRTLRTLSGGEAQRVSLTSALGSSLVNMLYVLDEPTAGLHPYDVNRLIDAIRGLRARGNSVVVVEHDEDLIRAADQVVEVGPAAGAGGGQIVFQGTPAELVRPDRSLTGEYLAGRRGVEPEERQRRRPRGWIKLLQARGHNLQQIDVEFPLGVLCLVTGVSGSGKSTLVEDTLYGALCKRKRRSVPTLAYDDVVGDGQIDDVILVDQSPISRSPRSNPVTYIKAFDAIRTIFAETLDARTHNYGAGHFSFNAEGGRCEACSGDGYLQIDMQFLADVYMRCGECQGTRYRREILQVRYRDRNVAEVLEMTVRQAIGFFRGHPKVTSRLKPLVEVGLDYLQLGQPANTLSAGEAQRLKLAAYLSTATRRRTLFILDEPTTGLHFSDIAKLLDCFAALVEAGHSLIVVEHNRQVMQAADWIIDIGPGAAHHGGRVVACGPPEQVIGVEGSRTGSYLRTASGPSA
jgi:excinuclease ABC subunit A